MRRQDVHIPEPCHADWQEMDGDSERRFCDACSKHVHDLSAMTRDEARTFMAANQDGHVCVQYLLDDEDQLIFRDDSTPEWKMYWQRDGISRLIAAAALVLPMSLAAACDSPQPSVQPSAETPIVIQDGQAPRLNPTSPAQPHAATQPVVQPGAGRAPTFHTAPADPPTPDPAPDTDVRIERGEVAPMPDTTHKKDEAKDDGGESCDQGEKGGEKDDGANTGAKTEPEATPQPVPHRPVIKKGKIKRPIRKLAGKPMPSKHFIGDH